MSQRAFLQAFDAAVIGAFADAGLADRANYYAAGGAAALPCEVLVDRSLQEFGDDPATVAGPYVRIGFQRAQVQPARRGRVALLDDAGQEVEAFVLAEMLPAMGDESMTYWVVQADG